MSGWRIILGVMLQFRHLCERKGSNKKCPRRRSQSTGKKLDGRSPSLIQCFPIDENEDLSSGNEGDCKYGSASSTSDSCERASTSGFVCLPDTPSKVVAKVLQCSERFASAVSKIDRQKVTKAYIWIACSVNDYGMSWGTVKNHILVVADMIQFLQSMPEVFTEAKLTFMKNACENTLRTCSKRFNEEMQLKKAKSEILPADLIMRCMAYQNNGVEAKISEGFRSEGKWDFCERICYGEGSSITHVHTKQCQKVRGQRWQYRHWTTPEKRETSN